MSAGARGSDHYAAESALFQQCRIEPRALLHREKGTATTPVFLVVSGEDVVGGLTGIPIDDECDILVLVGLSARAFETTEPVGGT